MSKNVRWYSREFQAAMDRVETETLDRAAAQCLGHARVNIRNNGQIDTGFMVNSGYMVSAKNDTYGQVAGSGAGGRTKAPQVSVRPAESATAFAAEYSIYQEMHRTFLYKALGQTVRELGGTITAVGKEELK